MAIVASETYTATSAPIQYAAVTAFQGGEDIETYLFHSRRILKALAKYLVKRLAEINIKVPMPQGAFYLFPDFGLYREKLSERGIFTSVEMCKALLEETGVAILPGHDFGREPAELTARLAFVDFEGEPALAAAQGDYMDREIDGSFIRTYAPRISRAFDLLNGWFTGL
jgi:aspartate aminotransferase